jgi:Lar family restriction alleviation protein
MNEDYRRAAKEFVDSMKWTKDASEDLKSLVIGNIHGFTAYLESPAFQNYSREAALEESVGRFQDLACAVSDILWGGELGWARWDDEGKDGVVIMIQELRKRIKKYQAREKELEFETDCPFCGGESEPDGDDNGHFIRCKACGARSGYSASQQEAFEKWNERRKPHTKKTFAGDLPTTQEKSESEVQSSTENYENVTLKLSQYEAQNLAWLLQIAGNGWAAPYGEWDKAVGLNTGDWNGTVRWKLEKQLTGKDATGGVNDGYGPNVARPNWACLPGQWISERDRGDSKKRDVMFEAALPYQVRIAKWMLACFGPEISKDKIERNHRFLEEALELVQSNGCTRNEAIQLVDYVFNRPIGDLNQECGGVMVTLAALSNASELNMIEAGEKELARIWEKIDSVREKQKMKPSNSPLPS